MISALNRLPNGNIELTITIPWKMVKGFYERGLDEITKKMEIKGFRKGKAPKKLVEGKVDKTQLYQEILKNLIPQVYTEAIKEQKIKPVIPPKLELISASEEKDWQIRALTCELPEVKLDNYREEVKKALASQLKQTSEEEKLRKIFKALLTSCQVQVPEIFMQDEVNRMLSRLIDQTTKLGLTVEQYLVSQKKSIEQLRAEYRQQAEELLKLEFILLSIADEQKIQISDAEVEKMVKAVPDTKTRKALESEEQKLYIRQLLRKRRVIDNLSSL